MPRACCKHHLELFSNIVIFAVSHILYVIRYTPIAVNPSRKNWKRDTLFAQRIINRSANFVKAIKHFSKMRLKSVSGWYFKQNV